MDIYGVIVTVVGILLIFTAFMVIIRLLGPFWALVLGVVVLALAFTTNDIHAASKEASPKVQESWSSTMTSVTG